MMIAKVMAQFRASLESSIMLLNVTFTHIEASFLMFKVQASLTIVNVYSTGISYDCDMFIAQASLITAMCL